jgi:hypothetical protein
LFAACAVMAISLFPAAASAAEALRAFRNQEGQAVQARFEGVSGDLVKLRLEDGRVFELAIDRLSKEDQAYVVEAASRAGDDSKKLNEAAGHDFVTGEPFSRRDAAELAKALQLRPESQSRYGHSWRLYASFVKGYTLFGAMPYSVALYSDQAGQVTGISVVYANKGDFGSTAGFAQDHFKSSGSPPPGSLAEAMSRDEETVKNALTAVLGPATTQRFGEGKTRRSVMRWDWNGHAFLLSHEEGEYVGLAILSSEVADAGGKSDWIRNAEIKDRLQAGVVTEANGDVRITEIPMVDQGPKGYCVPATFERAMRTMGIDADMYLLAMVGQSNAGGGTVVELLLENVRSQVYRKGRRTKEEEVKQLRIRDVKRYIDQGIPVMWTMFSMEAYNEVADKNTKQRADVEDWGAYAATIAEEAAKVAAAPKPDSNRHICMIIGYNEKTHELAVSDSWGARFELRWVPLPVANWASQGKLFMILP